MGEVLTKKLKVDPDVVLHGSCFAVNDEACFGAALTEYDNRQALNTLSRASVQKKSAGEA